ncbi:MAG: hypothetical protein K2G24_02265 [Muribaculaceae bacterium]|nr:hypothetical protein [Muribaculaceae bacterium]
MKKILLYSATALTMMLTSCLQAHVSDDSMGEILAPEQIDIEVTTDKPGSNMVIMRCNTPGVIPYWTTPTGKSTRVCDTIIAPFTGEFKVQFVGLCGGGASQAVEKTVNIERFDYEIDPMYVLFAGENGSKKWVWDPNPGRGGSGCYGAGGYGWSPDVPNWGGVNVGDDGVYADEYLVFDLNGGANVTLHRHDGTEQKGTFAFNKNVSSDRAALTPCFRNGEPTGQGWLGTVTLSGTTVPCGELQWGMGPARDEFEIAVLSPDEMVLIQWMGSSILCDPDWATGSTHWCFVRDGVQ